MQYKRFIALTLATFSLAGFLYFRSNTNPVISSHNNIIAKHQQNIAEPKRRITKKVLSDFRLFKSNPLEERVSLKDELSYNLKHKDYIAAAEISYELRDIRSAVRYLKRAGLNFNIVLNKSEISEYINLSYTCIEKSDIDHFYSSRYYHIKDLAAFDNDSAILLYNLISDYYERKGNIRSAASASSGAADLGDESSRSMAIELYRRLSEDKEREGYIESAAFASENAGLLGDEFSLSRAIELYRKISEDSERKGYIKYAASTLRDAVELGDEFSRSRAIELHRRISDDYEREGDIVSAASASNSAALLGDEFSWSRAIELYRIKSKNTINACNKLDLISDIIYLKQSKFVANNFDDILNSAQF
jgi:hypothetical protein